MEATAKFLRFEAIQFPEPFRDREWNKGVFGKDRKLLIAIPLLFGETFQADVDRLGDSPLAILLVLKVEGGQPFRV